MATHRLIETLNRELIVDVLDELPEQALDVWRRAIQVTVRINKGHSLLEHPGVRSLIFSHCPRYL